MHEKKQQVGVPSMDDSLQQKEKHSDPISDSPAGILLKNFIATMNKFGEDAQEENKETLKAMRKQAEEIISEIARAFGCCQEDDYPFRWALVYAAAELRHPATVPFLKNLVMTPIPPERSKNPHSYSTVAEETILRTTAVEGVGYLAKEKDGNEKLAEVLFDFLKQPSLSVRRASVQALLALDDSKKQRNRLAKLLPEDQHFILDIERKKVEDVSQIKEPQRHLREAARQREEKESPPRIPGEPENDAPQVH